MVVDIVFRRVRTPAERAAARRVLAATRDAYRSPHTAGEPDWCGLWDLTAEDGTAPVAVAATAGLSRLALEVRGLAAARGSAMWERLVRELADAGRAHGVEWMVAGADCPHAMILLRRNGFVDAAALPGHSGFAAAVGPGGLPAGDAVVWLAREI